MNYISSMICGWDTSIKVKPYYYIPVKACNIFGDDIRRSL